jgi:site-specific DNA recombinase
MKTIYAYLRVSTKKQQEKGYSLGEQEKNAKEYAATLQLPLKLFQDVESGASKSRKGWKALLEELEKSSESDDVIYYGSQSRMARDALEFQTFKNLCMRKKLKVFERREGKTLDFSKSKADRLYSGFQAVIDEEDRRDRNTTTSEGLKAHYDSGMKNYNRIFGYKPDSWNKETGKRTWIVIEEEAKIIREIFALYVSGTTSINQITKIINEQGYRTRPGNLFDYTKVKRILTNPIYAGLTKDSQGNRIESKKYAPIIDTKTLFKVSKHYSNKHQSYMKGRPPLHEGTGILKCSVCGYSFIHEKAKGRHYYRHRENFHLEGCPSLRKFDICNYILQDSYARAFLDNPKEILATLKSQVSNEEQQIQEDIDRNETILKNLTLERDSLTKALMQGKSVEYFTDLIDKKNIEMQKINSYIEELKRQQGLKSKSIEDLEAEFTLDNLVAYFESTNSEEKRNALKKVIKAAMISTEFITVELIDGRKYQYPYRYIKNQFKRVVTGRTTWNMAIEDTMKNGTKEQKIRIIKLILQDNAKYFQHKRIDTRPKLLRVP